MKTSTLDQTFYKWLCGGLLLGLVLGVCFTVLLRPSIPAPFAATEGGNPAVSSQALSEELHRAQQLADQGKTEEASRILEKLTLQFPNSPEPYNNLAAVQAAQGELESSRELLEKALRTHEGYAAAYENLGVIYSEIARDSYGKALRLDIAPSTPQLKVITVSAPPPPSPVMETAQSAPTLPAPAEAPRTAQAAAPPETQPPPPEAPQRSVSPAPPSETQEILQILHDWAQAWSNQDVASYLSYYSEQFRPDDGMERVAWEAQRRQRIHHPSWIKVSLDTIVVTLKESDSAQIRMVQDYSADTYKDRTRKTMTLVREDGVWRILTEITLGLVR